MKSPKYLLSILTLHIIIFFLFNLCLATDKKKADNKKVTVDIGVNKEDKEVGLKRMDLLDKALSPELLKKKRALVKSVENDYNTKINKLLQPLTTSIGKNTIITHVDVNFFDPDFEQQVRASQRVSVSIIMGRAGFENWASRGKPEQETLDQLKGIIQTTFKIPKENISIIIAPN